MTLPSIQPEVGHDEAEGFAASLRQQATWIDESREGKGSVYQRITMDDIDTDEMRAAADLIEQFQRDLSHARAMSEVWKGRACGVQSEDVAYPTLEDWLNETENYSLRAERIPPGAYPWIAEAWKLGAASVAQATVNDDLLRACKSAAEWLSGWASAEPYLSQLEAAIARASTVSSANREADADLPTANDVRGILSPSLSSTQRGSGE